MRLPFRSKRPPVLACVPLSVALALVAYSYSARGQGPEDRPPPGASPAALKQLDALKAELPPTAKFTVGYSKAYESVVDVQEAILKTKAQRALEAAGPEDIKAQRRKAFDLAVRQIAGTVIPKDFLQLARQRSLEVVGERGAPTEVRPMLAAGQAADPEAPSFDWRKLNKVTPVRDQDSCGSCWCFTAVSTFEDSYLLQKGGSPTALDASEQYILNCGNTGGCDGDWYWTAWKFMERVGTATEKDVPYKAIVGPCKRKVKTPYKVLDFGLVSTSDPIPSRDRIKEALCKYGPLAIAVQADNEFVGYKEGLFTGFPSEPTNPDAKINHAITLIGWDDDKGAWLIKNSWGGDWGSTGDYGSERGYMWIDYDSNNVGFAAAWVKARR